MLPGVLGSGDNLSDTEPSTSEAKHSPVFKSTKLTLLNELVRQTIQTSAKIYFKAGISLAT